MALDKYNPPARRRRGGHKTLEISSYRPACRHLPAGLRFLAHWTKIRHNRWPIREPRGPKLDVLTRKAVGSVLRAVVNEKVADIEVFVVAKDEPLVRYGPEIFLHPKELVRPRGWILPGRSGENVRVESVRQFSVRIDRTVDWVHEREDAWHFIQPARKFKNKRLWQACDCGLRVD
jgi:hypothetical protein